LTDCLSRQSIAKSALEEVEMAWMELQEKLEEMTNAFESQ
ncbi:ABC transporter ATP-binding protein, partial [Enterobacter hormaechei]|nr:ABC transporter ATP-binding protein [Enterobacter hormaechei]